MKLTQALLAWLPRFFDRDPLPFIALRIRHSGQSVEVITGDTTLITTDTSLTGDGGYIAFSATWQVADRTLTATMLEDGEATNTVTFDLAEHTIASLADALDAAGFAVTVGASPAQGTLSALILCDGEGDSDTSNGDALYAWTSLLFAYLQPMAAELEEAGDQIGNMLLQMETQTAETEWLDFIGSYYAVPRIMAPCVNLLRFSNDLSQAPSPWTPSNAAITKTASGSWLMRASSTAPASHNVVQALAIDTPYTYTATWRVRAAGYTKFRAKIADDGTANGAYANFDMATGEATADSQGTGITYTASMTAEEDGWWLCRITGLPAATGSVIRMVVYLTDASFGTTFSADPLLGIELEKFQLERGDQPSPYTPSGTLTPEEDRTYGRRIITEVLRPRGNNLAISSAILEATGQVTSVIDVTTYGSVTPAHNAVYSYDAAILHDSAAEPIYGLFDAETAYDLLGADPPTLYIARVREAVDRLRDAGTHLRSLTLASGAIEDPSYGPTKDVFSALTLAPTLTDDGPAPSEEAGEALGNAALAAMTDTAASGSDDAGLSLTITYGVLHDGLRLYDAAVPYRGGVAPAEAL